VTKSSPNQAPPGKKRYLVVGNLTQLQRLLWHALREAAAILDEAEEVDTKLRAVHAIAQASSQYSKLLEVGEFEQRLRALEAAAPGRRP